MVVYAATFVLFAIDAPERQFYFAKALALVGSRTPRRATAVSEGA